MTFNKIKCTVASVVLLFVFSGFFTGTGDIYFEVSKSIDIFSKVYKEISFNYVDEIQPEKFMEAGIQGMLQSLDPYTIFIDENKKDEIDLITNGKYGGVGISIGVRGNNVTVIEVLDGYSAQRQGIRIGDVIIQAGGVDITPENIDEVSSLVKGKPGTVVDLKVVRGNEKDTIKFNLVREEVIVKNLIYYGFYPENSNNVYMKLASFSRSAGDEIKKALRELKTRKEIKSVILDLRGNPGGLLDVAVDITEKFIPKNQLIVSTKGRNEINTKEYISSQEPMFGEGEMVLLVNEGSASASEIIAGALQDHDRAVLVGNKTYGKGLVQTITPLSFNTSLKITTAKYYTPSGRCIQKIDYTKDNDVFTGEDSLSATPFLTDNKRIVYSAGGITPDSIVSIENLPEIVVELLAKGVFFKFADHYYYNNPQADFSSLNDDKLFEDFKEYLSEEKFTYQPDADKLVDRLIQEVKDKRLGDNIVNDLKKIRNQFEIKGNGELKLFKDELIKEIKFELASRYLGTEARIMEALKYDDQFQAALD
ncbi:MAG TPA: S41 family peptidase, partial [Ignavibacteriaceae bacterium]|nr:S41 family peptidase [Ignavibacteriaceae bacterium]